MGQVASKSEDISSAICNEVEESLFNGKSPSMKRESGDSEDTPETPDSESELQICGQMEGNQASSRRAIPTSRKSGRVAAVRPTVSNPVCPADLEEEDQVDSAQGEDREQVVISIAPPEKWSESASEDEEMEDGEISDDEKHGVSQSQCYAWGGKKKTGLDSWGEKVLLKRRKLDVPGNDIVELESSTASSSSSEQNQSRFGIEFDRLLDSSTLEQSIEGQSILDHDPTARSRNYRAEEESLLLPLFREVIDAERKKKSELEDENRKLKSMLAKVSLEKEETFQLLRQSNKTLTEVTNSSAALEKRVEELNNELAEKNALIKALRKDTSVIRSVLSRMNKTLDDMQYCKDGGSPRSESGRGESTSRSRGSADKAGSKSKDSKSLISLMDLTPNPFGNSAESKPSSSVGKSPCSTKTVITSSEEEFIMTKLKDLKKWAYTLQDIKRIDGKWRCPECGDSKFTLLATAAHARDKHVWKIGAGLKPRMR